jgi:hypothetical protein
MAKPPADLASFFCAIGEAFSAPGGYFGGDSSRLVRQVLADNDVDVV